MKKLTRGFIIVCAIILGSTIALANSPNNEVTPYNWLQVAYKFQGNNFEQPVHFTTQALQGNIIYHTLQLATPKTYANDQYCTSYFNPESSSFVVLYKPSKGPQQQVCQITINNDVVDNNDWFKVSQSDQTPFHCHITYVDVSSNTSYLDLLVY